MLDAGRHPLIDIAAYSEVKSVSRRNGAFRVRVTKKARYVNEDACNACGDCAAKCPTKSIVDRVSARPRAVIGPSCTGCGDCVKVCLFKAIEGEPGEQHSVIHEKCIGCGLCRDVCNEGAVTIAGALGHLPEE